MIIDPEHKSSLARRRDSGVALLIVLAMMVLLLGIIVAFLSRSGINRDTSASSASLTAVDLLASLAVGNVIGNLQEEIRDPSRSTSYAPPNGGDTLYLPTSPQAAVPALDLPGLTAADLPGSGMENLLKVSTNISDIPTNRPSLNGRRITPARWNKALLMKRTATDGSDDSPPSAFPVPDWILVARDGSNPGTLNDAKWDADTSNPSSVIGRYAFVIYNQGGLLDANVAGYPASADVPIAGTNINKPASYKPSVAYADLTIPEIGLTQAHVETLVNEWRNQATLATSPAAEYFKLNLQNRTGFLSTSNTSAPGGATDRMFIGRHQLINFFEESLDGRNSGLMDSLQYFTTFSRSTDRPSFYRTQGQDNELPNYDESAPRINLWNSNVNGFDWRQMDSLGNSGFNNDAIINPIIPAITMDGSGRRINGTPFVEGDPLMLKRFPLDLLLWVTYKGPSSTLLSDDPLVVALGQEGITRDHLNQGTAANIRKAFGLDWTPGPGPGGLGGYWTYGAHSAFNPIDILEDVAKQNRDPDFFELLKATVNVGTLGRAREGYIMDDGSNRPPYLDQMRNDSFINNHILQLGANLIDQVHPENYPTRIVLPAQPGTSRTSAQSFWGTVDLPYLYGFTYGAVLVHAPATPPPDPNSPVRQNPPVPELIDVPIGEITEHTGAFLKLQFPILWNPHGQKASLPAGLSPQNFRICVTTSSLALPSEIGDPIDFGDIRMEDFSATGRGSRNLASPEFRSLMRMEWQTNASYDDGENPGVIRFGPNDRTALLFDAANPSLFRQPTPLFRPDIPGEINLRVTGGHQLSTVDLGTLGSRNYTDGVPELGSGQRYLGFHAGRFPVRYNISNRTATNRSIQADHAPGGFTYSLEYTIDGGTTWIPYKQIPVPIWHGGSGRDTVTAPWEYNLNTGIPHEVNRSSLVRRWAVNYGSERGPSADRGRFFLDPRTSRWGTDGKMAMPQFDPVTGVFTTLRPGAPLGSSFLRPNDIREVGAASKTSQLLDHRALIFGYPHWATWSEYPEGVGPTIVHAPFYDSDNVLRRPMGAWLPDTTNQDANTTIGLPLADGGQSTAGANPNRFNRPIILHRPFRSVTEMSYAFSDSPWRNIDFFTPESGFTGLLDVFTVSSDQRTDSVVAGKVDLNTRQMPVLKALLAGGYRDTLGTMAEIPTNEAQALAQALIDRTNSSDAGKGPLWNLAHLVGRFDSAVDIQSSTPSELPVRFDGFSADLTIGSNTAATNVVQRLREAPIRILSQTGQAGTWNLLIDLVAQAGRYPASAQNFNNFIVEGEKRVWLHLAIDRLTGKVIDYEIEEVTE
jgi:hypothetical protein